MSRSDAIDDVGDLNRIIHEPARLKILAQLYVLDSADFLFVMRQTGLTQGNLSSHINKLEEAGYIDVEKGFEGKRPRTMLKLTAEGRTAFAEYAHSMQRLFGQIESHGSKKGSKRRRSTLAPA